MASVASAFKVDLHTHPIPDFYRDALINAGHETRATGEVFVDGWRTPDFAIKEYIQERIDHGYNYSMLSITAPGVSFLKGNSQAQLLARRLNDEMAAYIKTYPKQLGAFACLPIPNTQAALEEIAVFPATLMFLDLTNKISVLSRHPQIRRCGYVHKL